MKWKKRGRLRIREEDFGNRWELVVLLSWASVIVVCFLTSLAEACLTPALAFQTSSKASEILSHSSHWHIRLSRWALKVVYAAFLALDCGTEGNFNM